MYINWKPLIKFGFIFWILLCATDYFGQEPYQIKISDPETFYENPIIQEMVDKKVHSELSKLQSRNDGWKFNGTFIIFNIITFALTVLFCTLIKFFVCLAIKCQFNMRKIFVRQNFFPIPKMIHSKIPVLSSKPSSRKSDSNIQSEKAIENVKTSNSVEGQLNETGQPKTCEMLFKNDRFSPVTYKLNCAKLRDEIIKLQSNSLKEHATLSRKLDAVSKEKKELSRHLAMAQKENRAAKEQLKELLEERTLLLKRLENATKEFKLSTTTKKVALARLEEVTENVEHLQCQLEQVKRDKEIIDNKFNVLEAEYVKLQDRVNDGKGNPMDIRPERDETQTELHNSSSLIGCTLPQAELDMKKIKEKIKNLEKCLDSFSPTIASINADYQNSGDTLESDVSSSFFDHTTDSQLRTDDYSETTESPRSRNWRRNGHQEHTESGIWSADGPKRIVSSSKAFQNFLKSLQASCTRN